MKVQLRLWAPSVDKTHLPDWFVPNTEIDITIEQIEQLFVICYYNIQFRHGTDGTCKLYIDDRGFTNR